LPRPYPAPPHPTPPHPQLLYAHNIDLASQAAEAITGLAEFYPSELIAEGAIEGLVELLAECAEHARVVAASSAGAPPPPPLRRRTGGSGGGGGGLGASGLQGAAMFSADGLESVPAISTEAAAETVAATAWGTSGGSGAPSAGGSRPLSASSSRRASGAASGGLTSSPARRRRPSAGGIVGRQRPRVSMQSSIACLVCASDGHESCGFCPMSSALKGLLRLLSPAPAVQARFVSAGGVNLLFELMMPEVGRHHSRLMQSLASLLSVALSGAGGAAAQDEARATGGIEVLVAALSSMTQQRQPGILSGGGEGFDIYQLRFAILNALQLTIVSNPANKVAFREQAGFVPLVALLRQLLAQRAGGPRPIEDGEHLETACLSLLAAALPESPANQDAAAKMGVAPLLLSLLCGPNAGNEAPQLRILAAGCLGRLAEHQQGVAEEAVAAGAVQALIGRLQHEPYEEEEQVGGWGGG
jgi:hypothetical protein